MVQDGRSSRVAPHCRTCAFDQPTTLSQRHCNQDPSCSMRMSLCSGTRSGHVAFAASLDPYTIAKDRPWSCQGNSPWTRFVVRRAAVFPCSSKRRQVTQAYDLDGPVRPATQLIAVTLITLKQHEKRFLANSQPLVANCLDDSGKRRKLVRWLLA